MNADIRRAVVGDERTLAQLNAFIHAIHLACNPDYFKPPAIDEVAAWFGRVLERPSARIWIAESNGDALGYLLAHFHHRDENVFCKARRWLEIGQVGVRPESRRAGIARALVRAALEAATSEGIGDVELTAWSFNEDAQAAFRRLGFTPRHVRYGLTTTDVPATEL